MTARLLKNFSVAERGKGSLTKSPPHGEGCEREKKRAPPRCSIENLKDWNGKKEKDEAFNRADRIL